MPKTEHMIILPDYQSYTPAMRDKIKKALAHRQSAFDFEVNGRLQRFNIWHLTADFALEPTPTPVENPTVTGGKK